MKKNSSVLERRAKDAAMRYLIPGLILLFCAPAFFVEARMIKPILILSGFCMAMGALACAWPRLMPADFLIRHPALADTPLQPMMASLFGSVLLLFGIGLLLALGSRVVWQYFENQKR